MSALLTVDRSSGTNALTHRLESAIVTDMDTYTTHTASPVDGIDICACGAKYWDGSLCHSCGDKFVVRETTCDRCHATAPTDLTDMGESVCLSCLIGEPTHYIIHGLTPTDEVK